METIPVLVFVGIIVLFAAVVVWAIANSRKEKEWKALIAQQLGFRPVAVPDPHFVQSLFGLQHIRQARRLELRNVAVRPCPDGEIYLYDLYDTSGDETSTVADSALAFMLTGRSLPRFIIYPRIASTGVLAGWVNLLVERLIGPNMEKVAISGPAEFNEHYLVIGADPASVVQILTPQALALLARNHSLSIQADGEIITFGSLNLSRVKKDERAAALQSQINLAQSFVRFLG